MRLLSLFLLLRVHSSSAFAEFYSRSRISLDCDRSNLYSGLAERSSFHRRRVLRLRSNEDSSSFGRHLSSSAKERREEERRRAQRLNDAVIGKTSAKKGAKDYCIQPDQTLKELIANSNQVEQEIYAQTERGKTCLNMLNVEGAWEAFQRVYQLKPSAYIFQAGISLFYLGDFNAAGECFARNAQIYEARFGLRASEERLWRDACELMMVTKETHRRNNRQPAKKRISFQVDNESADKLSPETRKIISIARGLFDASVMGNHYEVILSRAKLLWIANNSGVRSGLDSANSSIRRSDPKLWKLNSWYYLGLHYDVLGMEEESKKCMKNALKLSLVNSNAKDDFIHTLPMLHLSRRDWFDDEPLDDDTFTAIETFQVKKEVEANIQNSVDKLLLSEIQDALGRKGLKTSGGNKSDLKQRLLTVLMEDANALIFEER